MDSEPDPAVVGTKINLVFFRNLIFLILSLAIFLLLVVAAIFVKSKILPPPIPIVTSGLKEIFFFIILFNSFNSGFFLFLK